MKELKNIAFLLFLSCLVFTGCEEETDVLPPKACLIVDDNYPVVGQLVTFTDCSEDAYRIEINFGDGTLAKYTLVKHSYNAVGTYFASLLAWSEDGSVKTESVQKIIVSKGEDNPDTTTTNPGVKPSACFTPSLSTAEAGADVLFLNCSLNAASFAWNFGDGTTSTLQNPTHAFTASGSYQVKLTATNANGSDDTTISVVVGERVLQTIVLQNFNPLKPSGVAWDDLGFPIPGVPVEPDVFVQLTSASGSTLSTAIKNNLATSALPATYDVTSENLTLKNENWTVIIIDDEGFFGTDEEMMRWDNVNLGTLGSSGVIQLSSGSYTLEFQYTVQ